MNKTQLIASMAEKCSISLTQADKTLTIALDGIVKTLQEGGTVSLVGFGSFGVKQRSERTVRNPQTKEPMVVKATQVPYFKPSKNLKETVDPKE